MNHIHQSLAALAAALYGQPAAPKTLMAEADLAKLAKAKLKLPKAPAIGLKHTPATRADMAALSNAIWAKKKNAAKGA